MDPVTLNWLLILAIAALLVASPTSPPWVRQLVAGVLARFKSPAEDSVADPAPPTGTERIEHVIEVLAGVAAQRYPHMAPTAALERHLVDHLHSGYYRDDIIPPPAGDNPVSSTDGESAAQPG